MRRSAAILAFSLLAFLFQGDLDAAQASTTCQAASVDLAVAGGLLGCSFSCEAGDALFVSLVGTGVNPGVAADCGGTVVGCQQLPTGTGCTATATAAGSGTGTCRAWGTVAAGVVTCGAA